MKTLPLLVVRSVNAPDLLSLRDEKGSGTGMKFGLLEAGFQENELVELVDRRSYLALKEAAQVLDLYSSHDCDSRDREVEEAIRDALATLRQAGAL